MQDSDKIEEYIKEHIDPEGDYLYKLYRETHLQLLYPHMVSGHLQGRILKMLTHMVAPKNVLEIGTAAGYSAMFFAEKIRSFSDNDKYCPVRKRSLPDRADIKFQLISQTVLSLHMRADRCN